MTPSRHLLSAGTMEIHLVDRGFRDARPPFYLLSMPSLAETVFSFSIENECFAFMCVCIMCVLGAGRGSEEGVGAPGTGEL